MIYLYISCDYVFLYCFFGFVLGYASAHTPQKKRYASAHEAQDMEEDVDVLDKEEGDEPLKEYFPKPAIITEGVRRCNRSNGKGWFCRKLAHPGYAMCWDHIIHRRGYLQKKLHPNELQASTGRSEAVDWEETAGPSSPEDLSSSPAVPDDHEKPS